MRLAIYLDPLFLIPLVGLGSLSLAVLGSTAPTLFVSQLLFIGIGLALCVVFSRVDYRIYSHMVGLLYIASIILLALTFFGPHVRGATRWIDILGFRIQSSEIVKPFLFICFAYIMSKRPMSKIKNVGIAIVLFLPVLILVFKQPDLGNSIVLTGVFLALLLTSGLRMRYFLGALGAGIIFFPLFWSHLLPYQQTRIISFLNPVADPKGAGYNALQAIIAIGGGGIAGLGLGKGTQSHLLFLPEYHTDFVFASLVEELGFLGGIAVLIFYILLLLYIFTTLRKTQDNFSKYITISIYIQILLQVFINIGMNLGILPITGITLPLLSYGGSSLVSICISLGLVVSLRQREALL